jgi:restriction system protein
MDFTHTIGQVAKSLWFLIPIMIFAGIIKSAWFKGVIGEFIINSVSKLFLDKDEYHLLKNIIIPTEDGTTQIDHIIVSKFGVFVVETKNMKGWIFGDSSQRQWTQQIFKHKSKFQNPLHQNYKHVKTLESLLDIEESKIFSLVVFVGDSNFKTPMPENVCHPIGYIRYVRSKKYVLFSDVQVSEIINIINSGKLANTFGNTISHVRHVKSIVSQKEQEVRCPKCGSSMTLRTAKSGNNVGQKFWGCTTFPRCRGIKQVT